MQQNSRPPARPPQQAPGVAQRRPAPAPQQQRTAPPQQQARTQTRPPQQTQRTAAPPPQQQRQPARQAAPPPSQALDIRAMLALRDELDFGSGFFEIPIGSTRFRFLMDVDCALFYRYIPEVYIEVTENGKKKKKRFISPHAQDQSAYCPATECAKALSASGDKTTAKMLYPARRFLSNVVVYNQHDPDSSKVEQMKYPFQVWQDIVEALSADLDPEELASGQAYDTFASDDAGRWVTINKEKDGNNPPQYSATISTKNPVPAKQEWLDARVSFEEHLVPSPVHEMEEALCEFLQINSIDEILGAASPAQYEPADTYADDGGAAPDWDYQEEEVAGDYQLDTVEQEEEIMQPDPAPVRMPARAPQQAQQARRPTAPPPRGVRR